MSTTQNRKKTARMKALVFGLASLGLYAATFIFSDTIMSYVAKGHGFGIIPVATVFLFSWVHGTFAGSVWTALGIEASRKPARKQAEAPVRTPARPRANATVNA